MVFLMFLEKKILVKCYVVLGKDGKLPVLCSNGENLVTGM